MTAKTNAQRQADYRKRRVNAGENGDGDQRLNTFISTKAAFALNRLAKSYGVTKRELLEKLLIEADDAIRSQFGDDIDSPEWTAYHKVS
jgi:hypothetical protein